MHQFCFIFFLTAFTFSGAVAQNEWEIAKEKDGITIFTRSVEGNEFKAYRGVTELKAPVSAIIAALQDIPSYKDWMPNTLSTKVLVKEGDRELIYYLSSDAPWPVQDRDGVYRMRFEGKAETGTVYAGFEGLPDYISEKEGFVRIQKLKGYWRIHPTGEGFVHLTYEVNTDPGGDVPVWLVNSTIVSQPFKTLKALRERINLPQYQQREFSFLE